MTSHPRIAAVLILAGAGLLPAGGAQAQWYSSVSLQPPPLYPYAVQNSAVRADRPYAIEVAPGTYVIKRPGNSSASSHASRRHARTPAPSRKAPASKHRQSKVDPALIKELRKRPKIKRTVINTTKIVREPPIVNETTRYVDDPPRVIERYHIAEDKPARSRSRDMRVTIDGDLTGKKPSKRNSKGGNQAGADGEMRVIEAEAVITILGPDRMNIRLFRKGSSPNANARVN